MTPQVIANSMLFHSCKRVIDVTFKEEQRNESLFFRVSLTDKMGGCIFLTFPALVHNCSGVVSAAWKSFGLQRPKVTASPLPSVQDQRLKISLMCNRDEGLPHSWAHSGTDTTYPDCQHRWAYVGYFSHCITPGMLYPAPLRTLIKRVQEHLATVSMCLSAT